MSELLTQHENWKTRRQRLMSSKAPEAPMPEIIARPVAPLIPKNLKIVYHMNAPALAPPDPQEPARIFIRDIIRTVCLFFELDRTELLSHRRQAHLVRARQVAFYLCKTLSLKSYPEIGRAFDGRDHTTVLFGVRKIKNLIDDDEGVRQQVECIKSAILTNYGV